MSGATRPSFSKLGQQIELILKEPNSFTYILPGIAPGAKINLQISKTCQKKIPKVVSKSRHFRFPTSSPAHLYWTPAVNRQPGFPPEGLVKVLLLIHNALSALNLNVPGCPATQQTHNTNQEHHYNMISATFPARNFYHLEHR